MLNRYPPKPLVLGFLLFLAPGAALAQIPKPPANVQSPNVAAVVNAHSTAAAPYTGSVNVSVPLYTLQVGEVALPIGLRYAAQGFKPDEQAGWLGMGWSLEAGGVISRTVQDLPDELTYSRAPSSALCAALNTPSSPMRYAGFYWMPWWAGTKKHAWSDPNLPEEALRIDMQILAQLDVVTAPTCYGNDPHRPVPGLANVLDTEPDEFTFNAPGLSGKFLLSGSTDSVGCFPSTSPVPPDPAVQSCRWQIQCDRNVKVELLTSAAGVQDSVLMREPLHMRAAPSGYLATAEHLNRSADPYQPLTFRGFRLTTDDGTQYTFGGDANSVDYSKPYFQQYSTYWTASAWHLTRIRYPNGQIVRFRYDFPGSMTGSLSRLPDGKGSFVKQFYYSGRYMGNLRKDTRNQGLVPYNQSLQTDLAGEPWKHIDGQLVWSCYLKSIREVQSGATVLLQQGGSYSSTDYPTPHWPGIIVAARDRVCPPTTQEPCFFSGDGSSGITGSQSAQLAQISIRVPPLLSSTDTIGAEIRAFRFAYKASRGERRQLIGIRETASGQSAPPYRFTYYLNLNDANQGVPLPDAFTGEIDHWGFFNNGTKRLPPYQTYSPTGITRDPLPAGSEVLAQMGMLSKMSSPLGEQTEFIYEQHTYGFVCPRTFSSDLHSPVPQQGIAGGVRLKQLKRKPDAKEQSPVRSVDYLYYSPGPSVSSGVLAAQPVYVFPDYYLKGFAKNDTVPGYFSTTTSIQPLQPMTNVSGAPVGYSFITEKYSDGSKKRASYSNYNQSPAYSYDAFRNPVTYYAGQDGLPLTLNGQATPFGPFSENGELYGKLIEEEWFAAPENTAASFGRLTRRRILNYRFAPHPNPSYNEEQVGTQGIRISTAQFNGQEPVKNILLIEASGYAILTNTLHLTGEDTYDYDGPGGAVSQTVRKRYRYDTHRQLHRETILDPLGGSDSLSTSYLYPSSLFFTTPVWLPDWIMNMQRWRQWRYPLEVVQSRGTRTIGVTGNTYLSLNERLAALPATVRQATLSQPLLTGYTPWIHTTSPPPALHLRPVAFTDRALNEPTLPGTTTAESAPPTAYWWNPAHRNLRAVGRNITERSAAVEDFECGPNSWDPRNGGWTTSTGTTWQLTSTAHTGRYALVPAPLDACSGTPTRPAPPAPPREPAAEGQPAGREIPIEPCAPAPGNGGSGPVVVTPCGWNDPQGPYRKKASPFWGLNARPTVPTDITGAAPPEYILSFWARAAAIDPLNTTGSAGIWVSPTTCAGPVQVAVKGTAWQFYAVRFRFQPGDYEVRLGGERILLDDLRLYLADARLTTYTHEPLIGVKSVIDENNQTTRYEYDAFGRLVAVRDDAGNLVTTHEYHFRP
ncbi:MAG: RHS repeat protein [Hymenobacteraceae bacterium]|nr:RHS repeat protein [Hymenobacteraceae bacterium]